MALLKRKGFNTVACHGGEEILAAPGTMKPDLIPLTILMELTDGGETPGKIRTDPVIRDIPFLMFSVTKITPGLAEEHCLSIGDFSQNLSALPNCRTRSTASSSAARLL